MRTGRVSSWSASRTSQNAESSVVPSAPVPMGAEIEASTAAHVRPLQRFEITPALALFVAALPVLFLHAAFQPTVESSFGSTRVQGRLSDLAVIAMGMSA